MAAEPKSVTFETTVAVTGNNTGIVLPQEAEQLAAGKRPPVLINVNGYQYRNDARSSACAVVSERGPSRSWRTRSTRSACLS